ncbi:hypothetical protein E308F_07720 [Moorella sp. E308F]|nr:hypothetical protein E308F_07720 [Moorella sp. E308F]GEA18098.1 hypothetical protein E306M_12340 [Moorella sp. E306M]
MAKSITEINIKNKNNQWGGGGIICLVCKILEKSFPSISPLKITANNIPPNPSSVTFHNTSRNQNFLVIFRKNVQGSLDSRHHTFSSAPRVS